MTLGVIIVTFAAEDVIASCLETLVSCETPMRVLVVDNASPDRTKETIESWKKHGYLVENLPFPISSTSQKQRNQVTLLQAKDNAGFAAGVNLGLRRLIRDAALDRFWILNPDTLIPPKTAQAIASAPAGFSLMGNRLLYADAPHHIQIDAGTINRWSGVTSNMALGRRSDAPPPDMSKADFISGASMTASRAFIEAAGPMPEEYFLYYEEVDWAQRRGSLPLQFCEGAPVYHRAGSAIGSPTLASIASPFSTYYKHRARLMYLRRHHPSSLPTGLFYSLAKAIQLAAKGHVKQAAALSKAVSACLLSSNVAAQGRHEPVQRRA